MALMPSSAPIALPVAHVYALQNENAALKEELALLRGKMNLSTTLKCAGVRVPRAMALY